MKGVYVSLEQKHIDFIHSFMELTGNKFPAELRAILDDYMLFFQDKEAWEIYVQHCERRFAKQ